MSQARTTVVGLTRTCASRRRSSARSGALPSAEDARCASSFCSSAVTCSIVNRDQMPLSHQHGTAMRSLRLQLLQLRGRLLDREESPQGPKPNQHGTGVSSLRLQLLQLQTCSEQTGQSL